MNELAQQVGEIVKNISVVFDGKLNSESAVAITQQLMRYFYVKLYLGYGLTALVVICLGIGVIIVGYSINKN